MATALITQDIWPEITRATQRAQKSCAVAVAYFGAGASRLLPLAQGSRLVVDASERAVASGQTCPAELLKLVKRGVQVYSVPNLHAKVFVLGRTAIIGSTNVSGRSAKQLVEAVIRTTDAATVRTARRFVNDLCLHELTPKLLGRLAKLYRPPKLPGGKRRTKRKEPTFQQPALPRVLLAQLTLYEWSDRDQAFHDSELKAAKKRHGLPGSYELDSFRYPGPCPYREGDKVIQVTDEGGDSALVSPPGNVLHVRTRRDHNRQVSFVYLELPARRRRRLKPLAKALGRGAGKRLHRNGLVRNQKFAQVLLHKLAT